MAKKKVAKKKTAKNIIKNTTVIGPPELRLIERFMDAIILSIVIVGSIYLRGYLIESNTYQDDMCYAHKNNDQYYKTYAKIEYVWLSVEKINYKFASIDKSLVGIDRLEVDTRTRTLDVFKHVYPTKIDCALYEIHKVDVKLEQLKVNLEKK